MPEGGIGLLVWTLESGIESREILTERQAQLGKHPHREVYVLGVWVV